ncbi:hypothetical protein JCM10449v2_000864 [Rhodotorula kratochvilovae]
MEPPRQQQQPQQPAQAAPPAPPAAGSAAAASPPAAPANGTPQQHAPPARPYLPGPSMTSAEKSLFPNSMPVRQLPGIHSFSASPNAGAASPATSAGAGSPPLPGRTISGGADQHQQRIAAQAGSALPYAGLPSLPSRPSGGAGSPTSTPQLPAASVKPTPTPPVHPPLPSPAPTAAAPAPAALRAPYLGTGSGAPAPASSAQQQQQHAPHPAGPTQSSTSPLLSRGNPMSVSSMLSGPPRAQPVSAYSPLSAAGGSNGATPAPPTPQPPVLPPSSRPNAATSEQKSPAVVAGAVPRTQPGATLPAYASSLIAPAPAAAPHNPAEQSQPAGASAAAAARSSYPPLPSAFARENPYSPAAPSQSPAPSSGATTPQQQQQQQQQQQAAAAALKNSLFPNLGSYRPSAGSAAGTPTRTPGSASTGANSPYQWQAQAAQQAQQAQQQQQQQRFGQQGQAQPQGGKPARPGATTSNSAPTLGAAARPGQPQGAQAAVKAQQAQAHAHAQAQSAAQPSAAQQAQGAAAARGFPPAAMASGSAMDPYAALARGPPGANGQVGSAAVPQGGAGAAQAQAQAGRKRRRSDAAEQQQQQQQQQQVQAPPFQRVKSGASALGSPPATPSAASAAPLFTYAEWRKAMVHPPVVDVLNEAVDEWVAEHAGKGAEGRFLGRVTYDALTPPAKLLDGELLAQNVGGLVEVVVPTSWILGPPAPGAADAPAAGEVRSSCSVTPVDPHPVALSFGPPAAYTGEPLPLTSSTTPLVLPAHIADLPSARQREVWGTDVYTDDSDVLLVLLHSGWLRVTRRERRLRAGEKGAGADAIRRARTVGEERIAVPGAGGEGVPPALLVRLRVVPALVRYEGIERQGIRSRSWGNGHDGVSLRVEDVQPLAKIPPPRAPRARKPRAATCAQQLAALHRAAYPSAHAACTGVDADAHALPPPPPRRFRFAAPSAAAASAAEGVETKAEEEVFVTDTFVLDLRLGKGRFVGLSEEEEGGEGVPMEVEVA